MRRLASFTAIVAAPLAWLVFLTAEYALVPWACRRGAPHHPLLYGVALTALATAVASGLLAWGEWRRAGRSSSDEGPPAGRAAFMAVTGLGSSALFALVILAAALPTLWMSACD